MLRTTFAFLALLPGLAMAQQIDTSVDFTKLDRDEFVEEARRAGEASWSTSMAIFTRIDPSIAALVPDFPWGDAFEEGYGCLYDNMSASGNLDHYNALRDEAATFMEFLDANPQVSLINLDQYDEAIDLMTPSDEAIKAMQTCGVMDLNQAAIVESGMMQAVMAIYAAQEQQ